MYIVDYALFIGPGSRIFSTEIIFNHQISKINIISKLVLLIIFLAYNPISLWQEIL